MKRMERFGEVLRGMFLVKEALYLGGDSDRIINRIIGS